MSADTFAEQGAFIQAADAYKKALTFPAFPAGTHAAYGFVLLSQHDLPGAERELNAELASNPGSLMAKLGMARLHVEQGAVPESVKEIGEIWRADANFLRVNAALFNAGLPRPKRADLQRVLEERQATNNVSQEVLDLFRNGAATERLANMSQDPGGDVVSPVSGGKAPAGNAAELYARGRYEECTNLLASRLPLLPTKDLQRLAFCAYSTANFQPAAGAAQKLAVNAATEAEGLYWETRSAQKLATNALARASQLDSDSPKFHVLLGDVYRQRKYLPDAEQEYRKALALNAEDTGALVRFVFDAAGQFRSGRGIARDASRADEESRRSRVQRSHGRNPFHSARFCRGRAISEERLEHETGVGSARACSARKGVRRDKPNAGSDHGIKARARRRQGWTSPLSDCPPLFEGRGSRFSQASLCRVRSTTTGRLNPGSGRHAARREQQRFSINTIINPGLHTHLEDCDSVCQ